VGSPPLIGLIVSMLLSNYLGLPKPQCVSVSARLSHDPSVGSRSGCPWFEPCSPQQLCYLGSLLLNAASRVLFPDGREREKPRFLPSSFPFLFAPGRSPNLIIHLQSRLLGYVTG